MRLVLLEGGKPPSDIAHVTLSCSSGAAKPPHDACITVTAFKRDGLEKLPAPAATLSLAPSSKSDQRQAKKLQEFMKYLHHGVLGTSAPKVSRSLESRFVVLWSKAYLPSTHLDPAHLTGCQSFNQQCI